MTTQPLHALDGMGYAAFMANSYGLKLQHPHVVDCTRTRFHEGVPLPLREQALAKLVLPARGHRCHAAQAWAKRLAPWGVGAQQIFVNQGVRQSLDWLMTAWAKQGLRLALPADVYPVYAQTARRKGMYGSAYPLNPVLQATAWGNADVLLVTNPVKPRGTALTPPEIAQITQWLAQDAKRRVVVDAVYDLLPALLPGTQALWATGQAVVLHSLSKAWLSPWVAGVAVVPEGDVAQLRPLFRAPAGDGAGLAQAEAWLQQQPDFPQTVGKAFEQAREGLARTLRAAGLHPLAQDQDHAVPSYLLPVACSVQQGVQAGFIGLPASAFGAAWPGHAAVTVFSALEMLAQQD